MVAPRAGQQRAHRRCSPRKRVLAWRDQCGIERYPGLSQSLTVTRQAVVATLARQTHIRHVGDAAMAQRQQMPRRQTCTLLQVDADTGNTGILARILQQDTADSTVRKKAQLLGDLVGSAMNHQTVGGASPQSGQRLDFCHLGPRGDDVDHIAAQQRCLLFCRRRLLAAWFGT